MPLSPSPTPTIISGLIDFVYTTLAATLPDHVELLYTDDLSENPQDSLASCYGISVDEAENTEREWTEGVYWLRRNFTIIVCRSFASLYSDSASRKTATKDLLEGAAKVYNALKDQRQVFDAGGNQLAFDFKIVRDSGPRPIQVNDMPHMFIEMTISAEYRQT